MTQVCSALRRRRAGLGAWSLALALGLLLPGTRQALAADFGNGERAFVRQCALCHTAGRGEPNRYGPNLFGIVDRRAGTVPGFKYSSAFRSTASWNWSPQLLGAFIADPRAVVRGSPMDVFQGVAERDRDDIVAYLAAQK